MAYATWQDVPIGERNLLIDLQGQWEALSGYKIPFDDVDLLRLANRGALNLADIGNYFGGPGGTAGHNLDAMPWATYGLTKDSYTSLSTTFGSEYKKITGKDISAADLSKAFSSGQTGAGGLLTGSEYAAQLMSDKSIQDTFGWVKYGMDYTQFQQQKLGMQQAFGQKLDDSQAIAQLTYFHANQGADHTARAQTSAGGQQKTQTPGEGQSVVR